MKQAKLLLLALVAACSLVLVMTHAADATITPYISFQGKLTNTDGTNVTDGNYSVVFSLYTVASGGSAVWSETKTVAVSGGLFQTNLGDTTALPGSVNFNSAALYLGIKVGSDAEMTPRVQLTAAPQAFNADLLDGIDSTGYVQLSPGSQQTGNINVSGSVNGNTFSSSTLTFGAASAASIQSASGQALTVDSGTTGALNLGTSSNAKTITLGNTTGATAIAHLVGAGTNVFSVQGASSAVYFQLDTTNNRLYVGNPTADATGQLLVLDTKNTAGDPTGVNGGEYYNSIDNAFRCFQNSSWSNCITPSNSSTADQVVSGATTAYLAGSAIAIPSGGLHVGTQFVWRMSVSKTAAGTAASSFLVKYGTTGTTSDATEITFTGATETAAVDTGTITIIVTVRSVNSATGAWAGNFQLVHNGNTTGLATIPVNDINVTSASFNDTVASSIIGITVTTGTSDALTFQQVQASAFNL